MAYGRRPKSDVNWTVQEGDRYFRGTGRVYDTLRGIAARLEELQILYAVVGGLALFQHGYRRFIEDVDVLVRKEDLIKLHENLAGRGYLPKFEGSKNLRDTKMGVTIKFLVKGEYPGDGRPKPVSFPDPSDAGIEIEGIRYLNLKTLVELKLSSGMTGTGRLKDLADVQQLIRALDLPSGFANELNPYVREEFKGLWDSEHQPKWFLRIWEGSEEELGLMIARGVQIAPDSVEGRWVLRTDDPGLAAQFDMHEESEFM